MLRSHGNQPTDSGVTTSQHHVIRAKVIIADVGTVSLRWTACILRRTDNTSAVLQCDQRTKIGLLVSDRCILYFTHFTYLISYSSVFAFGLNRYNLLLYFFTCQILRLWDIETLKLYTHITVTNKRIAYNNILFY